MKVKSNLRAGMTFEECDQQRNYWKQMSQTGNCAATQTPAPTPPATQLPSYPPAPGTPPQSSCSWVNGVYYPDMSGICG